MMRDTVRLGAGVLLALTLMVAGSSRLAAEFQYLKALQLPTRSDSIAYPSSVVADPETGEVFVCDPRRNRILIFDDSGLFEFEINGGNNFSAPLDLAVDSAGFLLVTAYFEDRRTVLELDFDGQLIGEVALLGLPSWVSRTRLVSVALSSAGDRLYVLDQRNLRIWISDRRGRVQGSIDLSVDLTDAQRDETIVSHVDVYADRVIVALPRVGLVRAYDLDGNLLSTTGLFGAGPCELLFPLAAAADESGNYLIVDKHRMVVSIWDVAKDRCRGDYLGFGISPGYLYFPTDLALDANGLAYISQPFEGRVQIYQWSAPAAASPQR